MSTKPKIAHQMQIQLDSSSTESVLDRWNNFLTSLPSRFPQADARTLIHCVGAVSSAALRDITMADAKSFGYWCVTKTWVEEMLQWLAEKGGFLESGPDSMVMRPQKRTAQTAGFDLDDEANCGHSRPWTSYSEEGDRASQYGSPEATQSFAKTQNNTHFLQQNNTFNSHQEDHHQSLNTQLDGSYSFLADSRHGTSQSGQYRPSSISAPDESQTERASHQHPSYRQQLPQAKSTSPRESAASAIPSHVTKGLETHDDNDDSGICLDLELPPQRSPVKVDYNAFMNNTGTASDPADVVVC